MRYPALLLTISLVFTALAPAAQKTGPAATNSPKPDYLPAGPFFFEPGAAHPTYMDAFDSRPVVKSPDGKLAVTVTGPEQSYGAWVTVNPSTFPDGPVQAWPIQASVDVLWRADSQVFALTDNRYANLSYVLVFGTEFRLGESERELGVPTTDLTPVVRKAFEESARKYYDRAPDRDYETRLFYAKALRWIGDDLLLIGVSAMTVGSPTLVDEGKREWNVGYRVDLVHKRVLTELNEGQLLSNYRIRVAK